MNQHPVDLVDAFLDDALDAVDRPRLDDHLRACEHCRARLAEGLALRELLLQAGPAPVVTETPAFWDLLAPQLPQRRVGLGVGWIWGGVMLAVTLLGQAVGLAVPVAAALELSGVPISRWLAPAVPSGRVLGGDAVHALGETWVLAREYAVLGRIMSADTFVLLLFNVAALLAATGLALAFLGWIVALRRRRAVYVIASA